MCDADADIAAPVPTVLFDEGSGQPFVWQQDRATGKPFRLFIDRLAAAGHWPDGEAAGTIVIDESIVALATPAREDRG